MKKKKFQTEFCDQSKITQFDRSLDFYVIRMNLTTIQRNNTSYENNNKLDDRERVVVYHRSDKMQ